MAQYIDKDALVEEIGRRKEINKYRDTPDGLFEDKAILSFIDTLEVKEVDLEKDNSMKQEQTKFPGYDKALLEVKSKVDELYEEASIGLNEYDSGLYNGIAETCMKLRGFIKARLNSDEQSKVDLEKELNDFIEQQMAWIKDDRVVEYNNGDSFNHIYDLRKLAEHFFELGLKAQKGE